MNDNLLKSCSRCGVRKELSDFFKDKQRKDGIRGWCKKCWVEYHKKYEKLYRQRIKNQVLSHYSKGLPKCLHCGFSDDRALSIDHINGNGYNHRKSIFLNRVCSGSPFYFWLKRQGYPEGYQVLCMNCQFIKKIEKNESNHVADEASLEKMNGRH